MAEEKKAKSRASQAMSGSGGGKKKEKGKKKKIHKISISKLANGGYLAEHHQTPDPNDPSTMESEMHHIPDEAAMPDHFAEHMPSGPDDEAAEGEQPPAGGGAPAGPAMA